jgi:hypothetical protein
MESQRELTPAKRKMDDRDLRPDEVENHRPPPPPPTKTNGNHAFHPQRSSASPTMPRKTRIAHSSPPIWAQSARKRTLGASRNYSIKQHGAGASSSGASVNGTHHEPSPVIKSEHGIKAEHVSRHTSPEAARSITLAREEPSQAAAQDPFTFAGQPFPWEPSIEASLPIDTISRYAADFFVFYVLKGPNPDELRARGATIEIEAKLGTIIDKSTNDRIELMMVSAGDCIIQEGSRIAFRSSMNEVHRL